MFPLRRELWFFRYEPNSVFKCVGYYFSIRSDHSLVFIFWVFLYAWIMKTNLPFSIVIVDILPPWLLVVGPACEWWKNIILYIFLGMMYNDIIYSNSHINYISKYLLSTLSNLYTLYPWMIAQTKYIPYILLFS